jgi:transposase
MRVYVGMDVHRKRSQIAIVDDAGDERRNRNLPNDPTELVPILGGLPPGTPVAFAAATAGLAGRAAGGAGAGTAPGPSQPLPRRSPPPGCRNDKVDARTLAQLLRAELLPEAWIAPQATRDLRALLRHRARLVH